MTGTKRCPKVILEGTRLTHKTDLALALDEHPRIVGPRKYRYPSPLVSAEWCGFSNDPWGHGLINSGPRTRRVRWRPSRRGRACSSSLPYYSWIVDRFHLSTMAEQCRLHGASPDFGWLEERLRPLGFRIVLCTRRDETFPGRPLGAPARLRRARRSTTT